MTIELTPRCERITGERAVKMGILIKALQLQPLMRYQIDSLLGLSPSGCRKYVGDLRENQIIVLVPTGEKVMSSEQTFCINPDAARVAEFMKLIFLPGLDGQPRRRGRLMQKALTPDRQIHVLQDDEPVKVRLARKIPAHFDLLAQFFGMAPTPA